MLATEFTLEHRCEDLIALFNATFFDDFFTELVSGADEPLYLPAQGDTPARIFFRQDYFSSALHEISHWLIAGEQRRLLEDYGYWYSPDGRDAQQQQAFERVEVAPQALEWLLTHACQRRFRLSLDNLNGDAGDARPFAEAVCRQAQCLAEEGLSARADAFRLALAHFYGAETPTVSDFSLAEVYSPCS